VRKERTKGKERGRKRRGKESKGEAKEIIPTR